MVGVRNHKIMEEKERVKKSVQNKGLDVGPSLQVIDLLFDQSDPDGVEFQAGLSYRVYHISHVSRFLVFSLPTVGFYLQSLGFIPGYLMTFLECRFGQIRFIKSPFFKLNLCSPIIIESGLPVSPT
jgi:hypothetical protein